VKQPSWQHQPGASIVSAHTASQVISIVTVLAAGRPAAVAVALAVVFDALRSPVASSTRWQDGVPHLMRRLIEPGVPVVLGAARPAPQRQVAHPPALPLGLAGWPAGARHPGDLLRHTGRKRMPVRTVFRMVHKQWYRHPIMMP
jgi:hypothetical protein